MIKYRAVNRQDPNVVPEWLRGIQMPDTMATKPLTVEALIQGTADISGELYHSLTPPFFRKLLDVISWVEARSQDTGSKTGFDLGYKQAEAEANARNKQKVDEAYEKGHADGYRKGFEVGQDIREDDPAEAN